MTLTPFYLILTIANIVFFTALYLLVPPLRDALSREDQFMENLTTILFLETFFVGLYATLKLPNKQRRKLYLAIPIVGLLGFLSELSFGERIFYFEAPEINGVKIDAVHDFLSVIYISWYHMPNRNAVALAVVLIFGTILFWNRRYFAFNNLQKVFQNFFPSRFLTAAVLFSGMGLIIDLEIVHHHFLFFLEELFEMNGGLALLFSAFAIQVERKGYFVRTQKQLAYSQNLVGVTSILK
ncbi:MAG: hypothetical protein LRZ84_21025 [Desertifilum sp.]|nr:hypothetical protein [Desertifilum sp.]